MYCNCHARGFIEAIFCRNQPNIGVYGGAKRLQRNKTPRDLNSSPQGLSSNPGHGVFPDLDRYFRFGSFNVDRMSCVYAFLDLCRGVLKFQGKNEAWNE